LAHLREVLRNGDGRMKWHSLPWSRDISCLVLCWKRTSVPSADGRATEGRNEPLYSSYSSVYIRFDHDLDAESTLLLKAKIGEKEEERVGTKQERIK